MSTHKSERLNGLKKEERRRGKRSPQIRSVSFGSGDGVSSVILARKYLCWVVSCL